MKDILEDRFAGPGSPLNMELGYFFLRIMLGMNLFTHGIMRFITGISAWEQPLAATFVETYLPMPMVHFALYLIPVVEFIIGTFLLLGLLTQRALLGALLLFMVLMYGHTVRQNWDGVHLITHYGVYCWILLAFRRYNWLALDKRRTEAI